MINEIKTAVPELTPQQQELQSLQQTYNKLVHHPTTGFTAKQLEQHHAACKEALAAKRAAAEKLRQPPVAETETENKND